MNKYLEQARKEIQRTEHLIFVSLKYTRTVDVLKSVVERLISTFDMCIKALLYKLQEEEKVEDIPKSPGLCARILGEYYEDEDEFTEFLNFYYLLRKLSRAEFNRRNEYRRHVTMTAHLQEGPVEIDIDTVTEYFKRSKIFVRFVSKILENGKDFSEMLRLARVEIDFEGL